MMIKLEHYSNTEIEHNWKVFIDGEHTGYIHHIDGSVGGTVSSELDETDVFGWVCEKAFNLVLFKNKDLNFESEYTEERDTE